MAERKTLEVLIRLNDQITRRLGQVRNRIRNFASRIGSAISAATRRVAGLTAAFAALGATLALKSFVSAAAKIEQFQVQLEALFGSAGKAKAVLTSLREFAAKTPLETEDVLSAFVNLTAVGVKNARRVVESLGNIAVLFTKRVSDVASTFIAFEAEPLRKLGIRLDQTGKMAKIISGDIVLTVKKDMDSIQQAILEIFERRFPDAMERAAKTMKAQLSIFKSELFEISAGVGATLRGPIVDALKRINEFLNKNRDVIVQTITEIPRILSTVVEGVRSAVRDAFAVINGATLESGQRVIDSLNEVLLVTSRMIVTAMNTTARLIGITLAKGFQKIPRMLVRVFTSTAFVNAFAPIGAAIQGAVNDALNKSIENINRFAALRAAFTVFGSLPIPEIKFRFPDSDTLKKQVSDALDFINDTTIAKFGSFSDEIAALGQKLKQLGESTGIPERLAAIAEGIKKAAEETKTAREEAAKAADEFLKVGEKFKKVKEQLAPTAPDIPGIEIEELIPDPENLSQALTQGLKKGFEAWKNGLNQFRDSAASTVANIRTIFVDGLADGLSGSIQNISNLGDAFEDVTRRIITSLQRLALEFAVSSIFDKLLGPLIKSFSSALVGGLFGPAVAPDLAGAVGPSGIGIPTAPDIPFGRSINVPRISAPVGAVAAQSATPTIVFNVRTDDARSFDQNLAQRRNLIVGMVRDGINNSPSARQQFGRFNR